LGDPLKGKLAAVLQTSALGGPTLSTGKGGGSRHQRAKIIASYKIYFPELSISNGINLRFAFDNIISSSTFVVRSSFFSSVTEFNFLVRDLSTCHSE
jgi:hypothetical protein